jgi:hypothetical protein
MKTNSNTSKIQSYNQQRQIAQNPTDDASQTSAEKLQADADKRTKQAAIIQADLKAGADNKTSGVNATIPPTNDEDEEDAQPVNDSMKMLTDSVSNLIDQVNVKVNPVKSWIASQPTPGGLLAVCVFIGFMMLAIIPVNAAGQTRLYLFWNTLVGRTHMKYKEDFNGSYSNSQAVGGGSSGSFGGGGSSGSFGTSPTTATNGSTNGTITTGQPIDFSMLNLFNT